MGRKIERGDYGDVFFQQVPGGQKAMVNIRDHSGVRRRVSRIAATKAAARRAVLAHVEELLSRQGIGDYAASSPLLGVIEEWLDDYDSKVERGVRAPRTGESYRGTYDRHIKRSLSDWRLRDFTAPMLDRFLQKVLRENGYPTAKLCRTVMSGVAQFLVRRGAIRENPVADVPALEKKGAERPRSLSVAEAVSFIQDARAYDRRKGQDVADVLLFMLATGCRVGEALAMTWDRVDWEQRDVSIIATAGRVRGRGIVVGPTKSAAGMRTLGLPSWCLLLLQKRQIEVPGSSVLFPAPLGGYRCPSAVGRHIRAIRGTQWSWVTSHTFRRTMATMMDANGKSARTVADQLGHARVSMTLDAYMGRTVRSEGAEVLEVFAAAFGRGHSESHTPGMN